MKIELIEIIEIIKKSLGFSESQKFIKVINDNDLWPEFEKIIEKIKGE